MSLGRKWSVERVRSLLDFACNDRFGASDAMVQMQSEGVAAICEILRKRRVAYLADEVGLGKTMQGLGIATCLATTLPSPRILVISPRKLVQHGWEAEYTRFRSHVLRPGVKSLQPIPHESLRSWLPTVASANTLHLLRHSSFMRPVFDTKKANWEAIVRALEVPDAARRHLLRAAPQKWSAFDLNAAYATGINRWLTESDVRFDLVIVDEAQCLRHIDDQQTNTVLSRLLKNRVDNWLFLSATPVHSGVKDIATVLNQYAGQQELIPQACLTDLDLLKRTLANFMVRRPRTFLVDGKHIHKREYRVDDTESLKLRCENPLGLLSIALVQKHLARTMGARGGKFRNGYIASFESLEDSLRDRVSPSHTRAESAAQEIGDTDDQQENGNDFFFEHHHKTDNEQAPDEQFVSEASRSFEATFEFGLPHPKVDGVERDLALRAFGDRATGEVGATKSVVFCRRLSSVRVLRERLMQRYLSGIQARCLAVWGEELDWDKRMRERTRQEPQDSGPPPQQDEPPAADDGLNRVREAHARGNWLYRFRTTFVDGNRLALVFELNWFERLCREGGVEPQDAVRRVPPELWGHAHAFATGSGDKRYRAREAQYLVWRCLNEHGARIFGFDGAQIDFWREVLPNVLSSSCDFVGQLPPVLGAPGSPPQPELLTFRSIWSQAEARDARLALPDAEPSAEKHVREEALYWRKVVATVLGQYMRLSDAAIDLYFADRRAERQGGTIVDHFLDWLTSTDVDSRGLHKVWQDWIAHHTLIFSSAVGERENVGPADLAREESFDFLYHLDPVVGITGSAGGHKRALQQFNTPGLPYVMVGTDSIREGVNLHLFCDRVMHYGMPWTPGDMEQRVGRVDRFFGRIERRLNEAAGNAHRAQLQVLYPYLCDTIESQQIRAVMHRKRESDAVMEDDLGASRGDSDQRTVEIDTVLLPVEQREIALPEPFFGVARHLK